MSFMTDRDIVEVLKKMLPLLWDGVAERTTMNNKYLCDCAHHLWCVEKITFNTYCYITDKIISPSICYAASFESYLQSGGVAVHELSDAEIQSKRKEHLLKLISEYENKATPVVKISDILEKVRDDLWDGTGPQTDETHRRRYICHVIDDLEDISKELKNKLKAEVTDRRRFSGCFENYLYEMLGRDAASVIVDNKKLLQGARKRFIQRWINELLAKGE